MREPSIGTNVEGCVPETTDAHGNPKRGAVVDTNAGGSRERLYEIQWNNGRYQLCTRKEFVIDD